MRCAPRTPLLLALVLAGSAFAVAQSVAVHIGYEDKDIYFPDSEILIRFTISNNSAGTYRFRLADNRMFSVDFHVSTLTNQPLGPARQFTTQRTSNQQIFYRDVAIEPGESFSFVENLRDYVVIPAAGIYVIQARFYPDLVSGTTVMPSSNALSLTVQPALGSTDIERARIDDATGTILRRQALPPDQVVRFALDGLQRGAWNRFFLYMDIEGLLLSNPARARAYRALSAEARRQRLDEFRSQLQSRLAEPDLSAIPNEFRMIRTTYDEHEATVVMNLVFRSPTFSEVKRYTYFLRRDDSVWYIHDYAVTNLGTE